MSFHSTPREWPVPSAFIAASLAANRRGQARDGIAVPRTIGNLAVGEHAAQEPLAVPLEHLAHARDVGGIEAETDDSHVRSPAYRRLHVDARAVGPRAALHAAGPRRTCSPRATSCCATTTVSGPPWRRSLGVTRGAAAARQAGPRRPRGRGARRGGASARDPPRSRHRRHRRSVDRDRRSCRRLRADPAVRSGRSTSPVPRTRAGAGPRRARPAAAVRAMQDDVRHRGRRISSRPSGRAWGRAAAKSVPTSSTAFRAGGADTCVD